MIKALVTAFLVLVPSMALSCYPPFYSNLVDFISSDWSKIEPYQIVYGHFISIGGIEVEDVTDAYRNDYSASNFVAKNLTASAVFELIDPVSSRQRNGYINVEIWKVWDNGSSSCSFGNHSPDGYLEISFDKLLERDDEVLTFEIGRAGNLSYSFPLFSVHFGEPFTPAQRRALRRCIFHDACERNDLQSLRTLEPVNR